MTTLERHCQLLLRVYPAEYRDVRGEEIIGTLLEATPPGRSWPRLRDIWGLIFGGLRGGEHTAGVLPIVVARLALLAALVPLAGGSKRPSRGLLLLVGLSQSFRSSPASGRHSRGQRSEFSSFWLSPPASCGPSSTRGRP
ncbi:MAG TPA: hypothetical protein VMA32_05410 [Streptosporangiaceae bacterium]|nr:hypothetical protein [Streptosporangiaceae bacterium]